jgi:hypothetical protein
VNEIAVVQELNTVQQLVDVSAADGEGEKGVVGVDGRARRLKMKRAQSWQQR